MYIMRKEELGAVSPGLHIAFKIYYTKHLNGEATSDFLRLTDSKQIPYNYETTHQNVLMTKI